MPFFFCLFLKRSDQNYAASHRWNIKLPDSSHWYENRLKILEKFCQMTTFHGYNFLVDYSKPKWIRISSAAVLFLFLMVFIYFGAKVSAAIFQSHAINTSFTTETPDSQPFPNIHICDNSYFSKRRLKGDLSLL